MKAKDKKIGNRWFTPAEWKEFVSLGKKEQVEQIYNSLSPKDMAMAENLLKGIENGDSKGRTEETKSNNAATASRGKSQANNAKPSTTGTEG